MTWNYKRLNQNEQKLGQLIKKINNLIINYTINDKPERDADLIMDKLWLGNYHVASDFNFVTSEQIGTIINATKNIPNTFDFINYFNYCIEDKDACEKNLLYQIEEAADKIHYSIINKIAVLVHCKNGHHRSASIVAFYLIKYHNISLVQAVYLIKKARPLAFKRINCMLKTLILYENQNPNYY